MAKTFTKLTRPEMRKLAPGGKINEHGITFEKSATGDGVFTGGNIMLLRPDFVTRNWPAFQDAYAARKRIGKLASMIGIGVLARVILAQAYPGALKVAALERAVSRMLGGKVAAVISAYPEIGEDVDKPSDLAAVRKILDCVSS
jgi:hypothetical protein